MNENIYAYIYFLNMGKDKLNDVATRITAYELAMEHSNKMLATHTRAIMLRAIDSIN